MRHRQTLPVRYLFAVERLGDAIGPAIQALPRGSGVVLPSGTSGRLSRQIARIARRRGLVLFSEDKGEAVRVHDSHELRRALSRRTPLVFLSPLFPTRSHPGKPALARMRAATLARMMPWPPMALGGMNERRYAKVRAFGFGGWGAVDAWIRT